MTDIVERLRVAAKHPYNQHGPCEFLTEAADEIERLRAALEPFANALKGNWSNQTDSLPIVAGHGAYDLRLGFTLGDFRRARAALQQEEK